MFVYLCCHVFFYCSCSEYVRCAAPFFPFCSIFSLFFFLFDFLFDFLFFPFWFPFFSPFSVPLLFLHFLFFSFFFPFFFLFVHTFFRLLHKFSFYVPFSLGFIFLFFSFFYFLCGDRFALFLLFLFLFIGHCLLFFPILIPFFLLSFWISVCIIFGFILDYFPNFIISRISKVSCLSATQVKFLLLCHYLR